MDWQDDAACRGADPELFFVSGDGDIRPAKRLCASCPVRLRCLAFAIASGERFGVWGGLTGPERSALSGEERESIVVRAASRAA